MLVKKLVIPMRKDYGNQSESKKCFSERMRKIVTFVNYHLPRRIVEWEINCDKAIFTVTPSIFYDEPGPWEKYFPHDTDEKNP